MARKKHRSGSRRKKAIPLLPVVTIAAPFMMGGAWDEAKKGNIKGVVQQIARDYTGLGVWSTGGTSWNPVDAVPTWIGIGVGLIGHKVATRTGVNSYVRKATMGFFEL